MRRMFTDVEADVYVILDGDRTHDPVEAPLLIKHLRDGGYDYLRLPARTTAEELGSSAG